MNFADAWPVHAGAVRGPPIFQETAVSIQEFATTGRLPASRLGKTGERANSEGERFNSQGPHSTRAKRREAGDRCSPASPICHDATG